MGDGPLRRSRNGVPYGLEAGRENCPYYSAAVRNYLSKLDYIIKLKLSVRLNNQTNNSAHNEHIEWWTSGKSIEQS